ncbi:MAG: M23 family metallopeptidase [Vicinamibacterales bacterium]|nr:M23 family metallopeptidase [Vicinamibacterales bacterium]
MLALPLAFAMGCRLVDVDELPSPARAGADILLAPDSELIAALVPPRTTLAAVLHGHELAQQEVVSLIRTIGAHFDLRRLRAGRPYRLDRLHDGRVRQFEYEIDGDQILQVQRADEGDAFEASIVPIPKHIEVATFEGRIDRQTSSLYAAIVGGGEHVELALALAEVYSGEIDFNGDVHPGDEFRLVFEKATREDGQHAGYGPVLAAEFVNAGRRLRAVRFTDADGRAGYYDEQGRSLRRMFLKSPLKFEPRITSSFSNARRHPVLNYVRAHRGVDYGAPAGAPVVAVSSGVVVMAGWNGGAGRMVRIRHTSGYQSEYFHLSAIAPGVRVGARVSQGDTIGRVGATGLASGPHLHYGLIKNGTHVNPVTAHRNMPPGEPVAAVRLAAFEAERDRLFGRLSITTPLRAADADATDE